MSAPTAPDVAPTAVRGRGALRTASRGTSALSAAVPSWVTKAADPVLAPLRPPGNVDQAAVLAVADRHEEDLTVAVYEMLASWRKGWTLPRLRHLLATAPGTAADALDPARPAHGLLAEVGKASNGRAVEDVLIQIISTTAELPTSGDLGRFLGYLGNKPPSGQPLVAWREGVIDWLVRLTGNPRNDPRLRTLATSAATGSSDPAPFLRYLADEGVPGAADLVTRTARTAAGGFDLLSPHAISAAQRQAGALVTAVDQATMEAIRAIIVRGQTEGLTVDAMARLLRETIGLHPRQAQAVANLRALLQQIAAGAADPAAASSPLIAGSGPGAASMIAQGMTEEAIEEVVERYADRALRYRARLIARTETVRAANAGLIAGWEAAIDSGYLSAGEAWVEWFTNPDDRLCSICRSMAAAAARTGSTGFLDPDFDNGDDARGVRYLGSLASQFRGPPTPGPTRHDRGTPGRTYDQPPAHPGCRCTMVLHLSGDEPAAGPRTVRAEPPRPPEQFGPTSPWDIGQAPYTQTAIDLDAQRSNLFDHGASSTQAQDAKHQVARNLARDVDMPDEEWDTLADAIRRPDNHNSQSGPLDDWDARPTDRFWRTSTHDTSDAAFDALDPDFDRTVPDWHVGDTARDVGDDLGVVDPDMFDRQVHDALGGDVYDAIRADPYGFGDRVDLASLDPSTRDLAYDLSDFYRGRLTMGDVIDRHDSVFDVPDVRPNVWLSDGTPFDGPGWPDQAFVVELPGGRGYRGYVPTGSDLAAARHRYDITSALIHQWAVSSGDTNALSVLIQRRVHALWGVGLDLDTVQNIYTARDLVQIMSPTLNSAIDNVLTTMYATTQADLARRGVTSLFLGRGSGLGELPTTGPASYFVLTPASSFATGFHTPYHWADRSVWVEVPVDRVLSTPMTGFGCLGEDEVVVLGNLGGLADVGNVVARYQ